MDMPEKTKKDQVIQVEGQLSSEPWFVESYSNIAFMVCFFALRLKENPGLVLDV